MRYSSTYTPANYTFTGQYSDSYINLLWYGSRHYDPELGRFIQPDSIVPLASQGVQAWDRYEYVNNVPTRYTDPTGHMCKDGDENLWGYCELLAPSKVKTYQNAYLNSLARKYGIKLAPGDYWEYAESIMSPAACPRA